MRDYPEMIDHTHHVEPVPRRVRGLAGGRVVFDTIHAISVWESPRYPLYYVPLEDVDRDLLTDEGHTQQRKHGNADSHGLRVGERVRSGAARVFGPDADDAVANTVRFEFSALDHWFEEDEEIFVHPRNPYTRVDALRSCRHVQIAVAGLILAESDSTVMVFETGLPTRYYFDRTAVNFGHLRPSDTETACPYKGRTTAYWSVAVDDRLLPDLAWCYDFPTRQLLPIAGLVAFYNEKLDITIDGTLLERPTTPFS